MKINKTSVAFQFFSAVSAAITLTATASAALYDNGAPDHQGESELGQYIQAEDFVLTAPATVTSISFYELDASAYKGSLSWQIDSNNSGVPGTVLYSGTTTLTRTFTGVYLNNLEYLDSFSIVAANLAAGTYWLGLHDGPLTDTAPGGFYWETTASNGRPGGEEDIAPFGDGFTANGKEHSFQLNPVPEPSTRALLGIGALGLAAIARRVKVRGLLS